MHKMHSYLIIMVLMGIFVNTSESCLTLTEEYGQCINIRKCQSVVERLRNHPPLQYYDLLRTVHCGFEGKDPKICCEIETIPSLSKFPKTVESLEPLSIDSHPNLKLLDHKLCGPLMASPKIYGGSSTKIFEFPWMALLAYEDKDNNFEFDFRCGGTIINKNYIMTAAHCVINLPESLKIVGVRVGEHNLAKERDCEEYGNGAAYICAEKYQDFEIEKIYQHPEFSVATLRNDIALIRIKGEINFKPASVRPICLPLDNASRMMGKMGLITGWGSTEEGYIISDVLLQVRLPILPSEACRHAYRDQPFVKLWHKQICAGGIKAKDSCTGDSGGPLQSISMYGEEIRVVQQGVVSFGRRNCAIKGSPGVYTDVAYYVKWILDTIK